MEYTYDSENLYPKGIITLKKFILDNEESLKQELSTNISKIAELSYSNSRTNFVIYRGKEKHDITIGELLRVHKIPEHTYVPDSLKDREIRCISIDKKEQNVIIHLTEPVYAPIDVSLFK